MKWVIIHDKIKLNNKNEMGYYPLLSAVSVNSIEIVKLLMEYVNKNNLILEINEKNSNGCSPLLSISKEIEKIQMDVLHF